MKTKLFYCIILSIILSFNSFSQQSPWRNSDRIAVSMDGNGESDRTNSPFTRADPDDIGASAAILAMIAKLKLQDKLVHFDYNNWLDVGGVSDQNDRMKPSVNGGKSRWNFNSSVFFDLTEQLNAGLSNLISEINKSSASSRLYIIAAGPVESVYRAINSAQASKRKYVTIISHSNYNENEKIQNYHRVFADFSTFRNRDGLGYIKIKDQNGSNNPNVLYNSGNNFNVWNFLRDHNDPNLKWLFQRMKAHNYNVADISDAGMVYFLIKNDANGSPSKLKNFFGNGIDLPDGGGAIQTAYKTHNIPGTIQAEDYDNGGQGVAYNDIDSANQGGQGRTNEGVDIENTSDASGGNNVGWIANNEWLEYTIKNIQSGTYDIIFRIASSSTNSKSISAKLGNQNLGTVAIPNTGNWQNWQNVKLNNIQLDASSNKILRLDVSGGAYNINWVKFEKKSAGNDEVAFINPATTIQPLNSYDFDIKYNATTNREIVVEFWSPTGWLGQKMIRVSAGTGTANITVELPSTPPTGSGYIYKTHIRPIGTNWRDAIDRDQVNNVTIESQAFEDKVSFDNAPTNIDQATSYTFDISYEASVNREIVVSFWSSTGWIASQKEQVSKGKGTKEITVNLPSLPEAGSGYIYKTHIRPVGTNWQDALDNDEINNVTIQNTTNPNCHITEENGILIMEAESIPLKGKWVKKNDPKAKGNTYIQYVGPNYYQSPKNSETIEIKFQITQPGRYTVKWLMRQPDGVRDDLSNDAWINFPDSKQYGAGSQVNGFNKFVGRSKKNFGFNGQLDLHHGNQPWMSVEFDQAGVYTLQLSGRSELFQLDRIILYKGMNFQQAKQKALNNKESNCSDNSVRFHDSQYSSSRKRSKLSVYPNPLKENQKLSFQINDNEGLNSFQIHDQLGRVIYTKTLDGFKSNTFEISSEELNLSTEGIYYIKLKSKGKVQVGKFIYQK